MRLSFLKWQNNGIEQSHSKNFSINSMEIEKLQILDWKNDNV